MSDGRVQDGLPNRRKDDELAFLRYERLFRMPLERELEDLNGSERDVYWNSYNHAMQKYINSVISMAKALEIPMLQSWMDNPED